MAHKIFAVLAATLLTSIAFANGNDDDKARAGDAFNAMDSNRDERLIQNEVSGDQALAHFTAARAEEPAAQSQGERHL